MLYPIAKRSDKATPTPPRRAHVQDAKYLLQILRTARNYTVPKTCSEAQGSAGGRPSAAPRLRLLGSPGELLAVRPEMGQKKKKTRSTELAYGVRSWGGVWHLGIVCTPYWLGFQRCLRSTPSIRLKRAFVRSTPCSVRCEKREELARQSSQWR